MNACLKIQAVSECSWYLGYVVAVTQPCAAYTDFTKIEYYFSLKHILSEQRDKTRTLSL